MSYHQDTFKIKCQSRSMDVSHIKAILAEEGEGEEEGGQDQTTLRGGGALDEVPELRDDHTTDTPLLLSQFLQPVKKPQKDRNGGDPVPRWFLIAMILSLLVMIISGAVIVLASPYFVHHGEVSGGRGFDGVGGKLPVFAATPGTPGGVLIRELEEEREKAAAAAAAAAAGSNVEVSGSVSRDNESPLSEESSLNQRSDDSQSTDGEENPRNPQDEPWQPFADEIDPSQLGNSEGLQLTPELLRLVQQQVELQRLQEQQQRESPSDVDEFNLFNPLKVGTETTETTNTDTGATPQPGTTSNIELSSSIVHTTKATEGGEDESFSEGSGSRRLLTTSSSSAPSLSPLEQENFSEEQDENDEDEDEDEDLSSDSSSNEMMMDDLEPPPCTEVCFKDPDAATAMS